MRIIIGLLLGLLLLSPIFTNHISAKSAYDVTYESIKERVKGTPDFCILEPSYDPIIPTGNGKWMMNSVDAAIDAWVGPLKAISSRDAKWDINHIDIPLEKQTTYNYSGCDVIVSFKKNAPANYTNPEFILGVQYDEKGKSHIDIFYQDLSICERKVKHDDDSYDTYWFTCPTESPKPMPAIEAIARHEIGHALGLGHYISNEEVHVGVFPPSIMVPIVPLLGNPTGNTNPKNLMVMPTDLQKLIEIYGEKGWGSSSSTIQNDMKEIIKSDAKDSKKIDKIEKKKVTKKTLIKKTAKPKTTK